MRRSLIQSVAPVGILIAVMVFGMGATRALAEPIQVSASATVTSASGTWVPNIGSAFNANLVIDLVGSNSFSFETVAPIGAHPSARWYFLGAPYGGTLSGSIGSLTVGTAPAMSSIVVETIDDIDLDAVGNPFGGTGIADVMEVNIWGSQRRYG